MIGLEFCCIQPAPNVSKLLTWNLQVQVPEGAAVPELVKLKMETEAKLAEAALVWDGKKSSPRRCWNTYKLTR